MVFVATSGEKKLHNREKRTNARIMNSQKKINVSSGTLVDLKAELLRKQQAFRNEKLASKGLVAAAQRDKTDKKSVWSKSNAGVLARAQQDLVAKTEEDASMEKSRIALETKAKLYEKISNSSVKPEDDDGEQFLVDFERKAMEERLTQRQLDREEQQVTKETLEAVDPQDEWVDYVDQYGHEKRCLRKDLDELKGQMKPLKLSGEAELLSEDMRRELQRQKWQEEEEEMLARPAGPLHYSNVQFDEIRSHGVAYYQFSKTEEQRREQMEKLQELRKQTLEQRERRERVKEKRKALLAARLEKVKQRRVITTTRDSESDEEEQKTEEATRAVEAEPLTRDDSWRKEAPVRDWDKGKKADVDWIDKHRDSREEEFAPPSFYYDNKRPQQPRPNNTEKLLSLEKSEKQPSLEANVDSMLSHIRSHPNQSSSTAQVGVPQKNASYPMNKSYSDIDQTANQTAYQAYPHQTQSYEYADHQQKTATACFDLPQAASDYHRSEMHADGHTNIVPAAPSCQLPSTLPSYKYTSSELNYVHTAGSESSNMHTAGSESSNIYTAGSESSNTHTAGSESSIMHTAGSEYSNMHTAGSESSNIYTAGSDSSNTHTAGSESSIMQTAGSEYSNMHTAGSESSNIYTAGSDSSNTHTAGSDWSSQADHSSTTTNDKDWEGAKAAPMMYSSKPVKYAKPGMQLGEQKDGTILAAPPLKIAYERVDLHKVPKLLPAPPSMVNPLYPSQKNFLGEDEKDKEKSWHKQFSQNPNKSHTAPKTTNIPFPSPYIQNTGSPHDPFSVEVNYDPSKPPPGVE